MQAAQYNMAEMAAIGLMLLYPEHAQQAFGLLSEEMFESPQLAQMFACMQRMQSQHRAWDGAAVAGQLGAQYNELVMQCAACTGSSEHLGEYAAIVRNAWRERTLKAAALGLATGGQDADAITLHMRQLVARQDALCTAAHSAVKTLAQSVAEALAQPPGEGAGMAVPGWQAFNRATGGLARRGAYVIAGRPGRGKTDFALQMAVMLSAHWRVYYHSMEMPAAQLARRVVARVCEIPAEKLRDGTLSAAQRAAVEQVQRRMGELQLVLDETASVAMPDIERAIARHAPDVLFIDHLGLMKARARPKRNDELAELTRALKECAMRHNVAVVELVQAGRESEVRRMGLRDMFGSATIEQDADGVLALEPQAMRAVSGAQQVETAVNILKWREGSPGTLRFAWQPQYHRFFPLEQRREGTAQHA